MKKGKRITALLMSALMILGIMPTDWAVQTVNAVETNHTFNVTTAIGQVMDDTVGSSYGDNYFTIGGKTTSPVDANTKKSSDESLEFSYRLKLKKDAADPGSISFTTAGPAEVTVYAMAGGSGYNVTYGLYDTEGALVGDLATAYGDAEKDSTGSATLIAPATFTVPAAGTYTMYSLPSSTTIADPSKTESTKGLNVYYVNVEDKPATKTTTFNVTTEIGQVLDDTVGNSYVGNYFTVGGKTTSPVDANTKKSSDESLEFGYRLKLKKDEAQPGSISFTTGGPAEVTVYAMAGGSGYNVTYGLYDTDGALVGDLATAKGDAGTDSSGSATLIDPAILTVPAAGTYTLYSLPSSTTIADPSKTESTKGLNLYYISVKEGTSAPVVRKDWNEVAAPVLSTPTVDKDKITVPFTMEIGKDGADVIEITTTDPDGNESVNKINSNKVKSISFSGEKSGTYKFNAKAYRNDDTANVKVSNEVEINYSLPLEKPSFKSATSLGNGQIAVEWNAVPEADSYDISYSTDGSLFTTPVNVEGLSYTFDKLTVNQSYIFKLVAKRSSDSSVSEEVTINQKATENAQIKWEYSAYGNGINKNNSYEVKGDLGSLDKDATVNLVAGSKKDDGKNFDSNCGKIYPAATDGVCFYYTAIPTTKNFTLTATAKVNMWHFSNGQEGFGLMAADTVGVNGDDTLIWNNTYQAEASKVEYYYDTQNNKVSDAGDKITMKLGIGSQEKIGITKDNLSEFNTATTSSSAIAKYYSSKMTTLETSCAQKGAGTYNIINNYDKQNADSAAFTTTNTEDLMTEMQFTIQKNNTGYFITYTNLATGEKTTNKYYGPDALNKIDEDNVYAGFFVSRYADVTFENVELSTIDAKDDLPPEEKPTTYVTPKYAPTSASTSNTSSYNFNYIANADGKLTVTDADGNVVIDSIDIKENEKFSQEFVLKYGKNNFNISFTPNSDFHPNGDADSKLASYDTQESSFTVEYRTYGQADQSLWVSADGDPKAAGSVEDPLDIYTAVKFAQPGQTVVIKEGTYNLESTVVIPRGADGTADAQIKLIADPSAATRPVFDFGKKCAGMIFAGNYWYVQGFDVTHSVNGQKGIQVSGSNNTFDQINTYYNGNTGIQIARYLTSDLWNDWPANNLILNCTSYCNADAGYEDADGFAAKLTIADGNVFDGCISHNNADDGWDLFAKPESGPIGMVTIQNCVTYANGYWINEEGQTVNAGNGNGFKMGGSNIAGGHKLINSVSYDNKAKGIDSNSCPDIKIENSTSFNNGSYNVALYTGGATTDFAATGVLSYRKGTNEEEEIKPLTPQKITDIMTESNYFWNKDTMKSTNSAGVEVADDWFVSTDTSIVPTRFTDGTINMNGLLVLTDKAKAGAVVKGVASAEFTIPDSVPNVRPDLGGSDSANDQTNTNDSSNLILLMALCLISGSVFAAFYVFDKKRKLVK